MVEKEQEKPQPELEIERENVWLGITLKVACEQALWKYSGSSGPFSKYLE